MADDDNKERSMDKDIGTHPCIEDTPDLRFTT